MRKFRFRLDALLKHRRRLLEEHQKVVAARVQELAGAQDQLRRLDAELSEATEELVKNHLHGSIDLSYLAAHRRYAGAIHVRIARQMGAIQEIRQRLETERAALVQAWQAARVLERLRQRRFDQYAKQLRRAQEATSNEIGLNVFRAAQQQEALAC